MAATILLFRAVCDAEYVQWRQTRMFEVVPGSLDGKWFAMERGHAQQWGHWFGSKTGVSHDRIIAVKVPVELYEQFELKLEKLDGIGPACFAPISLLRNVRFDEVQE